MDLPGRCLCHKFYATRLLLSRCLMDLRDLALARAKTSRSIGVHVHMDRKSIWFRNLWRLTKALPDVIYAAGDRGNSRGTESDKQRYQSSGFTTI